MTKISELAAASALSGTELVPVVQGGVTERTTAQDIADLAQSGTPVFAAWTPTLTQSGTVTATVAIGRSVTIDKFVTAWFRLSVTGTGTANNQITVTLPSTAVASNASVGHGVGFDSSTGLQWNCRLAQLSTTTFAFLFTTDAGSGAALGAAGSVMTAALASGDILSGFITYEAA